MKHLRFGLMLNGNIVEKWQYNVVKTLIDNNIELALVVKNGNKQEEKTPITEKICKYPYKRLFFRLWNRYIFNPSSKTATDISDIIKDKDCIVCKTRKKGVSTIFNDGDIEIISSYHLDFLLRFGFNIIRGDILKTAHYGIWSFHHDDERIIRGGPPGFWEFIKKMPSNGVILQRLTDELDKGYIIKRVQFNTLTHSYKAHLDQIYYGASVLPLLACKDLVNNSELKEECSKSKAPILHPPRNYLMLYYFWLSIWRRITYNVNELMRQEDWNVGYCMTSPQKFIDCKDKESLNIQWFKKKQKYEYFADPFIIKTDKDTYIFFEWYSYKNGKGDIAVTLQSERFQTYHRITDFHEHRSYPYIFEYEGIIYCLPEAYQTGKLTLYRFNEEKLTLEEDSTLIEGQNIVDATLFYDNKKWYLFTVPQEYSHTHLMIYHADNLRGPYKEAGNNPVKIDCHSARPAGKILRYNNINIRPSQNCTKHYGQSIILNEIIELSVNKYSEKETKTISPIMGSEYNQGMHTINGNEEICVFDGKRFVFTWQGFKNQLSQKITKRRKRKY